MFAETMRQLRARRNISQKTVAEAVYISPSAISQYENGKAMPSRETLDRLARFFNVSTDYLLGISKHADLEELMNEEYIDGVTVEELLRMCLDLQPSNREALRMVVEAMCRKTEKSRVRR